VSRSTHRVLFGRLLYEPSLFGGFLGCFGSRTTANGLMAVLEDFRLVSVSPELQPFPPSPMDEACLSLGTHNLFCLHARHVIGQNPNSRIGTRPNQGREPPLIWSVELMKKVVHAESNDTASLAFHHHGP
jgi:hypothetical protein